MHFEHYALSCFYMKLHQITSSYLLVCLHCDFFQLWTDIEVGRSMDRALRYGTEGEAPQWMYQFNYNSWNNWLPDWMGE